MNKKDLRRCREQLLTLRERLRGEIEGLAESVRSVERPVGEHDQTVSEAVDRELFLQRHEENIQRQIAEALQRVEDGTYGICDDCGGAIGTARLDAVPYTSCCTSCQQRHENVATT